MLFSLSDDTDRNASEWSLVCVCGVVRFLRFRIVRRFLGSRNVTVTGLKDVDFSLFLYVWFVSGEQDFRKIVEKKLL